MTMQSTIDFIKSIIWSKLWVYVFVALVTVVSVTLLVCLEVRGPNVNATDIVEYPLDRPRASFPMIVNVSRDFNDDQRDALSKATTAWSRATQGVAVIVLDRDWEEPEPFDPCVYEDYPEYTVWLRASTDPLVAGLVVRHGFFDGVQRGKMIVIIEDDDLSLNKLAIVFAHELGHLMALEHLKEPYVGLMSPNAGDWDITQLDIIEFCYMYPCKSWRIGR